MKRLLDSRATFAVSSAVTCNLTFAVSANFCSCGGISAISNLTLAVNHVCGKLCVTCAVKANPGTAYTYATEYLYLCIFIFT